MCLVHAVPLPPPSPAMLREFGNVFVTTAAESEASGGSGQEGGGSEGQWAEVAACRGVRVLSLSASALSSAAAVVTEGRGVGAAGGVDDGGALKWLGGPEARPVS